MRTYFVNFVEDGGQNEGCAVIEVSEHEFAPDAIAMLREDQQLPDGEQGEWMARIMLKAIATGCMPESGSGGIAAVRLTDLSEEGQEQLAQFPKHRLIQSDEARQYGCIDVNAKISDGKIVKMEEVSPDTPIRSAWDS